MALKAALLEWMNSGLGRRQDFPWGWGRGGGGEKQAGASLSLMQLLHHFSLV